MESPAEEKDNSGLMDHALDQFPFMLHVLVVLVITYLFLNFTSNGLFYFCFFIVYLFEVGSYLACPTIFCTLCL